MNKSLEAMLRGYWRFAVNGEVFWLYNTAHKRRTEITEGPLVFNGKHLWKNRKEGHWVGFFRRYTIAHPWPTEDYTDLGAET